MIDLIKLNLKQKQALNELRKRMDGADPDYLDEDPGIFYRFLRARDFDVERAEKMLRKHISWRKSLQVHSILRDFKPREFYRKYIEPSLLGLDRKGDVISYIPMGRMDGKEVLKCVQINEYMRHWIWYCERSRTLILKVLKQKGSAVPQISFIVDLRELTLANTTSKQSTETCVRLMHLLQDNYPEALKSIYLINCPGYYVILFSILKAMMSRAMIQKFHVYGQDGWKEKLLEDVDADVLPAFLGGSRTDPDGNPLCKTFVDHSGPIPARYFLAVRDRDFRGGDKRSACVPPAARKEVEIGVTDAGSVIRWEFLVKNRDVGFGVFFRGPEEEGLTEVLPIQRVDTPDGVEVGAFETKFPGKYVIVFDNSYSWIHSKEIQFCVGVTKPEENG